MANSIKTTFSSNDYQKSHGKAPRGFGTWAFSVELESSEGYSAVIDDVFFTPPLSLTEAKKWAKKRLPSYIESLSDHIPDSVTIVAAHFDVLA